MTDKTITWRIAGGSGDGIDSTSKNFAKGLMREGYEIFTHRHYPSRIRGGHTFAEVRIGTDEVTSRGNSYDLLLALGDSFARNESENAYYGNESIKPITENLHDLDEGGVIVYDSGMITQNSLPDDFAEKVEKNNWDVFDVNLREIAVENGRSIMRNTAGVGVTCSILDINPEVIYDILSDAMDGDMLENNKDVFDEAYERANNFDTGLELEEPDEPDEDKVLLSGDDGVVYGSVDEGVQFISGYPMTPWTGVFSKLSQILPRYNGISEQVEDEIAACSMAVGASHAGAKAMSGSSGGGFALMSEPLGLAEMTETPIVLIEAQRGGPSTGLPTKPEQSDLNHVLHTGQGDSIRFVVAPGNIEEAYNYTRLAFKIAYEYQLPSIVMTDQKLSGELRTVSEDVFDKEPNHGDIGKTLSEDEIEEAPHHESGRFNRYRYMSDLDSSVSPRTIPGQKGGAHLTSGNEHNPQGHICEDPENREKMMDRKVQKLDDIYTQIMDQDEFSLQTEFGDDDASVGVITWGSQQGTVKEAIDNIDLDTGVKGLGVGQIKPYPVDEVQEFVDSVDHCIVVEMNKTAQFMDETVKNIDDSDVYMYSQLRYDGNPFRPEQIINKIKQVIKNEQ